MSPDRIMPQYGWFRCINSFAQQPEKGMPRYVSVDADSFIREKKILNPVVQQIVRWWFNNHACRMSQARFHNNRTYCINLKSGAFKVYGKFYYSSRAEFYGSGLRGAVHYSVQPELLSREERLSLIRDLKKDLKEIELDINALYDLLESPSNIDGEIVDQLLKQHEDRRVTISIIKLLEK